MAIRIRSQKEGFRRCGEAFSVQGKDYPTDRFNARELKILQSDPMLFVQEVPDIKKADKG